MHYMCFRCLFFIATVKVNRIFLVVYNNHQAFHQRYWRLKSWLQKKMAVKNRLKNTKRNTRSISQRYSVKKVFLEISQNSQENVRPSFISLFATLMDKTLVGAGESAGAVIWRFSVNKFTGNSQEIACVGVSF